MTICCITELYKIKYVYIKPKKIKEKGKWAGLGRQRATLSETHFLTHSASNAETRTKSQKNL